MRKVSEKDCTFVAVFKDCQTIKQQKKMKKVLFVMVAVAALTMSSCCNKKCKEATCDKATTECVATDSCCKATCEMADTCCKAACEMADSCKMDCTTCEKADSCQKVCPKAACEKKATCEKACEKK